MVNRTSMTMAAALLVLLAAPSPGFAKAMTIKQVQGLLTDLGYEPIDKGDGRIAIEDQGQFKNNIDFALDGDNTTLNVYSPLTDIPDEKRDWVPAVDLLKANDTIGPFTYAIVTVEGKERLDIEGYFDTSTVTKQMLRKTIDALISAQDAGEPLWGLDHWKAAAATPAKTEDAAKSYDAAQAEADAAWEREPLGVSRALIVTDKATDFRAYVARPDSTFKAGEKLFSYIEPRGFVFQPADNGTFKFGIAADVEIKNDKGDVVLFQKNVVSEPLTMHEKPKDYYVNLSFNLTDYPEGAYTIKYHMRDLFSPKVADATLPFSIVK